MRSQRKFQIVKDLHFHAIKSINLSININVINLVTYMHEIANLKTAYNFFYKCTKDLFSFPEGQNSEIRNN